MATIENFILKFKVEGAAGLKNLQDGMQNLTNSASGVGGALNKVVGAMGGLSSAALAGGAAFAALGMKVVNLADELQDMADASGIGAGALLNLKQSMIEAGGKADSFIAATAKLSIAVGEAFGGNEKYQKSFQSLGVFITDANGKLRDQGDILRDVIGRLAAISDPAERSAKAVELLGKEAAKIDWSKVSAVNDPFKDEQVAQLAKYREAIDKIGASVETSLITMFGKLAIEMQSAYDKADEIEKKLNAKGQAGILNPGFRASVFGLFGMTPTEPLITRKQTEAEKRAQYEAEQARLMKPYVSRAPASTATGGGFGATPEATLKAIADSQLRIKQSQQEAEKQIALRGQSDIAQIEINAKFEAAKAREEIFNKERLTESQKAAEYAAKEKEIFAKRDSDIAKNRLQTELRVMKEIMDQAEQDAKDMAGYYQQVDQARLQAFEQTDAIRKANEELKARIGLQNKIVEMGTIEADRAQKIFDIQQEQKNQLEAIAKIPNLPYNERLQKEEEINQKFRERIDLINQEADARIAREQDFSAGIRETMRKYEESITPLKQGQQVAESVYNNMGSALDNFVETGKFKFSDFARSVIMDLLKIQLRAAATQLFNSVLGTFGFGLPGKAMGGPVMPNQAYIVGERGPEVFLPKSAGNIIPNNKLTSGDQMFGGGSTTIINNISAIDAKSVAQLFADNRMTLLGTVESARRELPMRTR